MTDTNLRVATVRDCDNLLSAGMALFDRLMSAQSHEVVWFVDDELNEITSGRVVDTVGNRQFTFELAGGDSFQHNGILPTSGWTRLDD